MTTNNRNTRNNARRNGGSSLALALDPGTCRDLAQVKATAIENKRQQARDKAIAERRAQRQQERAAARAVLTPVSQDIVNDIAAAKRNIVALAQAYRLPVPNMKRINPEAVIAEAEAKQVPVTDVITQQADAVCAALRQSTITLQNEVAAREGNSFKLVASALLSYLAQRVVRASAALDVASAAAAVGKYYKSKPNAEVATKAVTDAEEALNAYYTVLANGSSTIVGETGSVNPNGLLRSYVKEQLAKVLKLKLDPKRDPLVYAAQVLAAKARKRNGTEATTEATPEATAQPASAVSPLLDVPAEFATDERSIDAARLCYLEKGVWPASKASLAAWKGKLTKLEKAEAAAA